MSKLLDNPEMLDTTINMLSSPMARPQVEQMAKQMNMNPDTLISVLKWLVRAAKVLRPVKNVVTNPIFKYGLIVIVLSYILYWLGFTTDLLFMKPFR